MWHKSTYCNRLVHTEYSLCIWWTGIQKKGKSLGLKKRKITHFTADEQYDYNHLVFTTFCITWTKEPKGDNKSLWFKLMSGRLIEQQHRFLAPKTLFRATSTDQYSHFFTGPFSSLSAVINQLLIPSQSLINSLSSQIKYFCWDWDVNTKTANPTVDCIRERQMDTIKVTEKVRMPHTNLYCQLIQLTFSLQTYVIFILVNKKQSICWLQYREKLVKLLNLM